VSKFLGIKQAGEEGSDTVGEEEYDRQREQGRDQKESE